MGPIELFFSIIALMVALVGVARGYHKELGSTVIILVAIFVLTFFQDTISDLLNRVVSSLLAFSAAQATYRDLILSLLYQLGFIAIVFAGYAGATLDFGSKPVKGTTGTVYSLLLGALNGYLIAGTLWYYQDIYGYPAQQFGLITLPLTETAAALVAVLPQNLFPTPIYWMLPVAALLIMRVRG